MAAYLKVVTPSLVAKDPSDAQRAWPSNAGENISAGDPVYLKPDGLYWRSNGTGANAAAKVDGWASKDHLAGSPCQPYFNCHLAYGPSSATVGARLFLSATLGQLDTAATTGGTAAIAVVEAVITNVTVPHAIIWVTKSTY